MKRRFLLSLLVTAAALPAAFGKDPVNPETMIPPNAKVYVAPMDGLGTYVIAGMNKKKTPVLVVADKEKADFIIDGASESNKVGWARTVFMGQVGTDEQASITCTNAKSGIVVYAYNVHKKGSARGKQSAGEAVAKHLKEKIESKQ
jgi:hypothetical protein